MSKKETVYTGEMLIKTVNKDSGFEKHIYIKNSFVKDGIVHINTEGSQLALKYDLEKIDQFIKSGIVSFEDGKNLKEDILSLENQMTTWKKWKQQNPNATKEEESNAFFEIIGSKSLDEIRAKKSEELNIAIRKLIAQKDSIEPKVIESLPELFKSINSKDCFAITKPIMDRIYHIPDLLENAEAINTSGDQWEIKSKLENRGTGPIGLSHTFIAQNPEDAKKYLYSYKEWMRGEGLKVLTAYWKTACERKWFHFSTPLSSVMKQVSIETRKMDFSVKERRKFWAATRKLENTKLTIELHFPHVKRKKEQKLIIEHRLVDVGARMHDIDEDTYPNDIMVKVLNPNDFQQQSQIGTEIHNNTLKLHPKDVLLALSLQTRKAQTMEKDTNTFDENFLIDRANLKQTSKSNKSTARKKLNTKLDKMKNENIIENSISLGKKNKSYTIKNNSKKKSN